MPCVQQPQLDTAAVAQESLRIHADSSGSCDSTQQLQADRQQEQALLVAEAYAAELQAIQGIGAATAKVLALTTALGCARHDSLQALCSWLASDAAHPEQLQHYLLHRWGRPASV
jgi:predicted flap endonuclease-1-like 5' DNA nuclease